MYSRCTNVFNWHKQSGDLKSSQARFVDHDIEQFCSCISITSFPVVMYSTSHILCVRCNINYAPNTGVSEKHINIEHCNWLVIHCVVSRFYRTYPDCVNKSLDFVDNLTETVYTCFICCCIVMRIETIWRVRMLNL